ncbi:MAG: NAD(P)-binding protein [Blastocatellia bacterium]|nr:NAD(P)-binding protein [Blastocatellia bacterium]
MFTAARGAVGGHESNAIYCGTGFHLLALSSEMKKDFDLAIVGSGFSASLLAMIARRLGLSVMLIERGSHPRFAIGESTSPLNVTICHGCCR